MENEKEKPTPPRMQVSGGMYQTRRTSAKAQAKPVVVVKPKKPAVPPQRVPREAGEEGEAPARRAPEPATGSVYQPRRTSARGKPAAPPTRADSEPATSLDSEPPRQQTPDARVARLPRPQDDGEPGAAREELARQALGDEVIDALKKAAEEGDELVERVKVLEDIVATKPDVSDLLIEMGKRLDAAEENVGKLSAQVDEIGKLVYSFGRELGSDSLPDTEEKKKG